MKGKKIKTIKLRGVVSQGILLPWSKVVQEYNLKQEGWSVGDDLSTELEIKKWEEPSKPAKLGSGKYPYAEVERPAWLSKYTDIENWNNWSDVIEEGEIVNISEKLHGSNGLIGLVSGKFYICSRNRCLRMEPIAVLKSRFKNRKIKKFLESKTFSKYSPLKLLMRKEIIPPENTVWHRVFYKYNMKEKLTKLAEIIGSSKVAIYGEVLGVQDLMYGLKNGELAFRAFDIRVEGANPPYDYVNFDRFQELVSLLGLEQCPLIYKGPFTKEVLEHRKGNSLVTRANHIREGVVIKPCKEASHIKLGRVVLKKINEDYLLRKKGTDY